MAKLTRYNIDFVMCGIVPRDDGFWVKHADAEAEIERLSLALAECAAEWRSPPTTMGRAMEHISVEFKRRMQLAADALQDGQAE